MLFSIDPTVFWSIFAVPAVIALIAVGYVCLQNMWMVSAVYAIGPTRRLNQEAIYSFADDSDSLWTQSKVGLWVLVVMSVLCLIAQYQHGTGMIGIFTAFAVSGLVITRARNHLSLSRNFETVTRKSVRRASRETTGPHRIVR